MSAECAFWNDYLPRLRAWADTTPQSLQCDITSEPINGSLSSIAISKATVTYTILFASAYQIIQLSSML